MTFICPFSWEMLGIIILVDELIFFKGVGIPGKLIQKNGGSSLSSRQLFDVTMLDHNKSSLHVQQTLYEET